MLFSFIQPLSVNFGNGRVIESIKVARVTISTTFPPVKHTQRGSKVKAAQADCLWQAIDSISIDSIASVRIFDINVLQPSKNSELCQSMLNTIHKSFNTFRGAVMLPFANDTGAYFSRKAVFYSHHRGTPMIEYANPLCISADGRQTSIPWTTLGDISPINPYQDGLISSCMVR